MEKRALKMAWRKRRDKALTDINLLCQELIKTITTLVPKTDEVEFFGQISDVIYGFVEIFAVDISWAITPENGSQRFVVKELFQDDLTGYPNYLIRFGVPADGICHKVGQAGSIYDPRKEALARAFETGDVVIINDARNDPATQYMKGWAEIHKINSLAVVPIGLNTQYQFLVVIDQVEPSEGFTSEQVGFLSHVNISFSNAIAAAVSALEEITKMQIENLGKNNQLVISGIEDRIGNKLVALGGFARRISAALKSNSLEKATLYAETLIDSARHLESFVEKLRDFRSGVRQKTIAELKLEECFQEVFFADETGGRFQVECMNEVDKLKLTLPAELMMLLLRVLKTYLEENDTAEKFSIQVGRKGKNRIEFVFISKAFQPYKLASSADIELLLASDAACELGGSFHIDQPTRGEPGIARVTLPINYGSKMIPQQESRFIN